MTAQRIHRAKVMEHLQVLKDALAVGPESRPATIGFHTTACALDLLELYLHKVGKIPIGMQLKHEWFKQPLSGQKILPLAERHLKVDFPHKKDILEFLYPLEGNRNKLIYGHSTVSEIRQTIDTFTKLKDLLMDMLREEGETFENADG